MKCQFCQQDCQVHRVNAQWYLCEPCKVFFHSTKRQTVFRPNSDTYLYWLFIDFDENSTKVDVIRNPKTLPVEDRGDMPEPKTILKIDSAMQGVTPQNMYEKLKTLMVFS